MGKKYLDTKKDSLESSILGVWKTAIEEGDARETAVMDGRTKGYREHRKKLESSRQSRESKKVNKEEVELDPRKLPGEPSSRARHLHQVGTLLIWHYMIVMQL